MLVRLAFGTSLNVTQVQVQVQFILHYLHCKLKDKNEKKFKKLKKKQIIHPFFIS